jgi:protein-tyrosine-phosphatase
MNGRAVRQAIRWFISEWLSKDTPYLMWLLSSFTVFTHEVTDAQQERDALIEGEGIEATLRTEIVSITREFEGYFSPESVETLVDDSFRTVVGTGSRHYLARLAGLYARERLRAIMASNRLDDEANPVLLFVCGRNAARSQMAAAFAGALSQGRVAAFSAGTHPAGEIDRAVIDAMAEVGVDLAGAFPKPLSNEMVQAADVIVTLGCGDACPLLPNKKYEDWPLPDPHGRSVTVVREVREMIRGRVEQLLSGLEAARRR